MHIKEGISQNREFENTESSNSFIYIQDIYLLKKKKNNRLQTITKQRKYRSGLTDKLVTQP